MNTFTINYESLIKRIKDKNPTTVREILETICYETSTHSLDKLVPILKIVSSLDDELAKIVMITEESSNSQIISEIIYNQIKTIDKNTMEVNLDFTLFDFS